jgi:hypothetical protein
MNNESPSVILRILDGAHELYMKGKGPNFLACVAVDLWERLQSELKLIPMVQQATDSVKVGEVVLRGSGFRVTAASDRCVPSGTIWVGEEPRNCCDILKCFYSRERIDAVMRMPIGEVLDKLNELLRDMKGNTP